MANLNFVVGCPGLLETLEEVHFVSKRRELNMPPRHEGLFFPWGNVKLSLTIKWQKREISGLQKKKFIIKMAALFLDLIEAHKNQANDFM